MERLVLKNNYLEAVICPEVGASIEAFRYSLKGRWVNVMRPTPESAADNKDPGGFSCFHLVPYSNRIENGLLRFKGKEYKLKINNSDGHAIHGVGWEHPWKVLNQNKEKLTVSFNSREYDKINWPFPFSSTITFSLEANELIIYISIKNEGHKIMPAGFGTHPYFSKKLTEEDDQVYVKLPVKGLYPGDTQIPTGHWLELPTELDFSKERALNPAQFIDNCFRAKPGSTVIKWPGSGVSLTMEADEIFENIVFYTPLEESFFAIEPVTNCNNGFNMAEMGIQDTGTLYLKPGEQASGKIRIKVEG